MNIHLLIPTHGRTKLLKQLLESLVSVEATERNTHIHLVENGSSVSGEIAYAFSNKLPLEFRSLSKGNKSSALNVVMNDIPEEDFCIFLDDDVHLEKDFVTHYQEAAQTYGPGHYYGGPVHPDYASPPSPEIQAYLPPSCRDFDLSQGEQYRTFPAYRLFLGANWACFASDLKRVGGFNPDYGPGGKNNMRGQEADAQQRLAAAGATPVFLRDARVHHHVSEKMVTRPWVIERIFRSLYHKGKEQPTLWHALGLTAKLIYSLLLLPLQPGNIGHLYRINKAAGYFYGLTSHYLKGKE